MDQYLSAVIIAIITGIFSVITMVLKNKQDTLINKINAQTTFIEKEKVLKRKLTKKRAEQESMMNQIMILVLDTNLHILRNTMIAGAIVPDESVFQQSEHLKEKFKELNETIQDISREYELLLELTNDFQPPKK